MKKTLSLIFIYFLLTATGYSQNLVPNPSFEDTIYCPQFLGDINPAIGWKPFGNSSDYFNACAPTDINVPNSEIGFQYAHTGNAMAGVVTWLNPSNDSANINYREFIGALLLNPLQVGQQYYFSFFINYSGYLYQWQQIAANKIGLKFSTFPYDSCCPPVPNNFAHLYTDSIYKDTVAWVKLSGSFISDSAYKYIVIGNFFDDAHTDTFNLGGNPFGSAGAYYYIDDVCVSTDSFYNQTWTGIKEKHIHNNKINIFPNPASDILNIKSKEEIKQIQVVNCIGQIIKQVEIFEDTNLQFSVSDIPSGIYFIRAKTKNSFSNSLINIIH